MWRHHLDLLLNYLNRISNENCITDYCVDRCSHLQLMFCCHSKESWWAWRMFANCLANQNLRCTERWGVTTSRLSVKVTDCISIDRRSRNGSRRNKISSASPIWMSSRNLWLPTLGVIEIDDSSLFSHPDKADLLRLFLFIYGRFLSKSLQNYY